MEWGLRGQVAEPVFVFHAAAILHIVQPTCGTVAAQLRGVGPMLFRAIGHLNRHRQI